MPFWSRASSSKSSTSEETNVSSKQNDDLVTLSLGTHDTAGVGVGNDGGALISPQSSPPSMPSTPQESSPFVISSTSDNAIVTEDWTRYLPEKWGIRKTVEDSSYRWCWKESAMWGIATGTVMGIHRVRMGSRSLFAGTVAFTTVIVVFAPSYYFCTRRRDHQEHVISMMMAANDWVPGDEMPETVPLDKDHPFLNFRDKVDGNEKDDGDLQKEFVARLKEKKEWQEPQQTQDADEVFKEVKK